MDDCFQDVLLNSLTNKKGILIITFFSLYMAGVQTLNSYLVGKIVDKQKMMYLLFYICIALSGYVINYFLDININKQVYDYSNSFFSRFMNIFFNADFNHLQPVLIIHILIRFTTGFKRRDLAGNKDNPLQAELTRELATLSVQLPEPAGDGPPRLFRPLFTARVREFRGELDGRSGAKFAYLAARPSETRIRGFLSSMPPQQADLLRRLVGQMKEDATYFLGVVTLREGEFEAAIDFLDRMTLAESPEGRWADAARINAAAAYAAAGQADVARRLLEADESPQRYGSRLTAARLVSAEAAEESSP